MASEVIIRRFLLQDLAPLRGLILRTIQTSYPSHYSPEAVQFFCDHHVERNILADIEAGCVLVLLDEGMIVATGSRVGKEIKRVFVDPMRQGHGFGSMIMEALEKDAVASGALEVELDSSLPAKRFYDDRGYETKSYDEIQLEASTLPYYRMRKRLSKM